MMMSIRYAIFHGSLIVINAIIPPLRRRHLPWYSPYNTEVYVSSSSPVIIYTDHNPLVFLDRMRNANQRLMRWSLVLQAFDLEIHHIRGKDNVVADALSRV